MTDPIELIEESPCLSSASRRGAMRVQGIVFASRDLPPEVQAHRSLVRVSNVATLPGIVDASYTMPDGSREYGFPIVLTCKRAALARRAARLRPVGVVKR